MVRMWMRGLSQSQIKGRQEVYGVNEVAKRKSLVDLQLLLNQFKSPLVWVLGVSAIATLVVKDFTDSLMIFVALGLNTILGFVQEYRVDKSLESLKSTLSPRAEVIREGKRQIVEASDLVPGDILFVSNAHRIAADGVIVENEELHLMEAILTGESQTVAKSVWSGLNKVEDVESTLSMLRVDFDKVDALEKVFMGTEVKAGVGKVLVVNTGKKTEVGKIAKSLTSKEGLTPLQKKLNVLTRDLAIGIVVVSLFVLISGFLAGRSLPMIFPLAVALAVAAIPEGLSLGLTVVMALGMEKILKKGGVVRHLAAAEVLGSVNVICIDKTGTLTEGIMKVTRAVTNLKQIEDKGQLEKMVGAAILCNDFRDPLELAMGKWANQQIVKMGGKPGFASYERIDSIPFNPQDKLIMTLHKWADRGIELLVSGAPEVVLSRTNLGVKEKDEWNRRIKELASSGNRLVGFGERAGIKGTKVNKEDARGLDWLGLLVYEDPVRMGVRDALEKVAKAGIGIKVITGDYKETGLAILRQLGLVRDGVERAITGEEMKNMTQEELVKRIDKTVLFARTSPEQKLRIVEALQAKGMVVAMTGDGVNDAPAIKKADIGIVVNEATEVAKETAELVLIKNDFQTIVDAVEEGRAILVNFRKVVLYLLSDAFTGIFVVVGSMVLGWPLPLLAAQILWINLVSDGFPYLALTVEPKPLGLLKNRPEEYAGAILNKKMLVLMTVISVLAGVMTLSVFGWYLYGLGANLQLARTMAMMMLGANSLFYVFSTRTFNKPIWQTRIKNWWLVGGVAAGWLMLLAAIYVPGFEMLFQSIKPSIYDWWWIVVGTLIVIGGAESVKLVFVNFFKRQ